jgi:hypothetical protein
MTLVYIGLSFTGALMAISASGVFAAIKRKVRRDPFGQRTGPKVNTIIQVRKENQNEH